MLATGRQVRSWSDDFAAHADQHALVRLAAADGLTDDDKAVLGRSIAIFQLGESGTGEHLIAAARTVGVGDRYVEALGLFIKEEQEHARLLSLVLEAIGQATRSRHWSDQLFVFIRRLKSLRTEVLTLLVAELIALRYYSALRDGVASPSLAAVFGRIHADEIRHVEFHAETFAPLLRAWLTPIRWMVRVLWNTLVTGTSVLVAIDHRRALRLAGVGIREFVADVWHLRNDLDHRLFGCGP